jgi:hypothetical protein
VSTEAQAAWKLLDAAAAGTLNLDAADAGQPSNVAPVDNGETAKPVVAEPAAVVAPEAEVEGAPIAAKSGSYTIPYEKLAEARGRAKTLEEENTTLKAQLADLSARQQANLSAAQAEATARASAGQAPTSADQQASIAQAAIGQGVDPDLFGDFSEEAIANGVKQLVDAQVSAQVQSRVDARVNELMAPMFKQQEEDATAGHYRAIYTAHPDTDSLLDSQELAEWQAAQPAFVQESIAAILKAGTAAQVIEVFDSFKAATGKPAVDQQAAIKAKVGAAIKAAADVVPASLSELSGGSVGVSDVERATALAGDPAKLMEFMASLSPEKANRLMNSMV